MLPATGYSVPRPMAWELYVSGRPLPYLRQPSCWESDFIACAYLPVVTAWDKVHTQWCADSGANRNIPGDLSKALIFFQERLDPFI